MLYRFAAAFEKPSRRVEWVARFVTGGVLLWSLSIPSLPMPGAPISVWWTLYRWAFLGQWTVLFAFVAMRLWGGSRHETSVARRRMRTLALAVGAMNGALLMSGFVRAPSESMTFATQTVFLVSSILFFVGLTPPARLVRMWRRPEELAIQAAMGALFRAETPQELAALLLPRAAELVAARGAALFDKSGELLGSCGVMGTSQADVRRVQTHTGDLLIWTSPYAPFFGPDEFALTESLGAFADIAMERFSLAETSRKSVDRFKSLLESAPDAMVIIDQTGRIVLVNRQAALLFGYAAGDLVGQPVEVLIPQRFAHTHAGHRANFAAEPRTRSMGQGWELYALRADGTEVPVEISLSPIDGDEGPLVSAAIRDITERKQRADELALALARAQEASLLKSTFLANMSHEIRTPMNGVMGMVGLLLDTDLNAEQRDYIETMADSAEALLAILGDILDLSKIEAGKLTLEDAHFDLRTAINAAIVPQALRAQSDGVDLTVAFDPALPEVVRGDRLRLRQVISNLVTNAVKFTHAGDVAVHVRPDERGIYVEVVDTGIGITTEQQATLFQPFMQGDASTTRRYGGTGLGLAICQELVELMGGEIGFASQPGVGSTFWFRVPLTEVPRDRFAGMVKPDSAGSASGSGRVLVVEDNAVNRKVAVAYLDRLGYTADTAEDGVEALEAMSVRRYDVVLLDCQMPRMDGYETASTVRLREKDRHTPIVAMTASAMPSDRERCLSAGMDDYLSKPLDRDLLSDAMRRWTAVPG